VRGVIWPPACGSPAPDAVESIRPVPAKGRNGAARPLEIIANREEGLTPAVARLPAAPRQAMAGSGLTDGAAPRVPSPR